MANIKICTKPGSAANITLDIDDTLNMGDARRDTSTHKGSETTGDVLTRNTLSSLSSALSSTAANLLSNFNDNLPSTVSQ
jgi:hypothetical protein